MSYTQLLPQGSVFGGDFEIKRLIGEGGMGAVFLVYQRSTNMVRALKIMHTDLLRDPVLRARFTQEAKIGSLVRSEHVVEVVTAGVDGATQIPFMVMEFLEGEDLEAMLARRGPLPVSEVRVLLMQLCHGLAMAHAVGIVHRDLKPENIFIARSRRADVSDTVKILDFGIAKLLAEAMGTGHVTQALGTPWFMAPEQANAGVTPSPAADVWALGLVVFTMLTGRSYWMSSQASTPSIHAILAEVLQSSLVPPSQRAAQVRLPEGFDAWFARCVNRNPNERFRDAGEAWPALANVLDASVASGHGSNVRLLGTAPSNATPTPELATVAQAPIGYLTPIGSMSPVTMGGGFTPTSGGYGASAQAPRPPSSAPNASGSAYSTTPVGLSTTYDRGASALPGTPSKQRAESPSRAWWLIAGLASLAALGALVALGLWVRTATFYCVDTVTQHDRLRCIREISAEEGYASRAHLAPEPGARSHHRSAIR
jgi:eukaryotic-like serine/threonine-protein kinase